MASITANTASCPGAVEHRSLDKSSAIRMRTMAGHDGSPIRAAAEEEAGLPKVDSFTLEDGCERGTSSAHPDMTDCSDNKENNQRNSPNGQIRTDILHSPPDWLHAGTTTASNTDRSQIDPRSIPNRSRINYFFDF